MHPFASIMRRELLWFIDYVKRSTDMLKSVEWSPYDKMATTLIGYSEVSGVGMGIWFPGEHAGFQCPLSSDGPKDLIFFYEALAICSAFHLGTKYACDHIAIYSDNTNAVDMFSSLRAKRVYNSIYLMPLISPLTPLSPQRSTLFPETRMLSRITFPGFLTPRLCAWPQTCRFKFLNPLGMRWGLRKNDSYHALVQAACAACLDNGSPHL
jgi:hypothetical protein